MIIRRYEFLHKRLTDNNTGDECKMKMMESNCLSPSEERYIREFILQTDRDSILYKWAKHAERVLNELDALRALVETLRDKNKKLCLKLKEANRPFKIRLD